MLTPDEIQLYKSRLENERQKLAERIGTPPQDFGGDIENSSSEEEADEAEEFANQAAANQFSRDRIAAIDKALERIQNGTYGKCEKCGDEISSEILNLAPESALCANCK